MSVAEEKLSWDDIKDWPESAGRTEIVDGELVKSPTPATRHQRICTELGVKIALFNEVRSLGVVFASPMHAILAKHVHFEPDLCLVLNENRHLIRENYIDGPPDLVIEVISESNRTHDTVVKFQAYAAHGVREYWLVDPREQEFSTWTLAGSEFRLLGRARRGSTLKTSIHSGIRIDPGEIFDRADR